MSAAWREKSCWLTSMSRLLALTLVWAPIVTTHRYASSALPANRGQPFYCVQLIAQTNRVVHVA